MFLTKEELGNVIYNYQIDAITEGDDSKVLEAIEAALDEIRSYLTGNNKKQWLDGRLQYDVDAILSKSGKERNALILAHAKTITKWFIVELCNADIIYEQAKERYDRSVKWLRMLANGEVTLTNLPIKQTPKDDTKKQDPFANGSRKKFRHE